MPRKAAPFWSRVQKSDGCWTWVGHLNDGYGVYGHSQKAHRVSWILSVGPIPDGLCVLHHCDNRACVRPDHLFLGTVDDNNKDRAAKGRSKGTFQSGDMHPAKIKRGERHWCAKVSDADVLRMRELHHAGNTHASIAREYQLNPATVSRLVRRVWRGGTA